MKRTIAGAVLCAVLCAAGTSTAAEPPPTTVAHPALWTVHGKSGTVTLLGAIHLLPQGLAWRDERVENAIYNCDTYVFEAPLDMAAVKQYVEKFGSLAAGQSLYGMLPRTAQNDLDADMALVKMPETSIDTRRPWLAALILQAQRSSPQTTSPYSGVDFSVLSEVQARGKPIRYLETFAQQMAFLAPSDPKVELESFEAFLKDFRTQDSILPDMIAAWSAGDLDKLNTLSIGSLGEHPDVKKALIDDRNKAWVKIIEHMLDAEQGTFLVTVGALHLVGPAGIPALLRADGYKVDGP